MSDLIKTILLGVIEGITEFLPVSSTGHLFLTAQVMGIDFKHGPDAPFWDAFNIVIQVGAIFAVVIYFRRRILDLLLGGKKPSYFAQTMPRHQIDQAAWALTGSVIKGDVVGGPGAEAMSEEAVARADAYLTKEQRWHAIKMVLIATAPILTVGLFIDKFWPSKELEGNPNAIALALLVGGLIMLLIEKLRLRVTAHRLEQITLKQAILIGFCQILAALFPGTSRSAATIMSALASGVSRPAATEFSFFLAIPAMFAACGYKLLKWVKDNRPDSHQLMLMLLGTAISFVVAWVVIAGFMNYVRKHSFMPFAIYRIVVGAAVLVLGLKAFHG